MRYFVSLGADPNTAPVVVDLTELPSGDLAAHVDERRVDLDVVSIGGRFSIRVDGHVVDLAVEGAPPDLRTVASGCRVDVRVESERMRAEQQGKRAPSGAGDRVVKSPMPGRVIKVLVSKGDAVEVGQSLLVLEAMKMENEVRAKRSGIVAEVHVVAGTAVDGNGKLVTLA